MKIIILNNNLQSVCRTVNIRNNVSSSPYPLRPYEYELGSVCGRLD
jgi:hypothetical protein